MSVHNQCLGATDEWYTPPHVFEAMRCQFDLDVSSPGQHVTPWIPARNFIVSESLSKKWNGVVWMNAPFGGRNGLVPWLDKFFEHGDGIALTPDRTSAPWWQTYAAKADAVLFASPKIKFIDAQGNPGKSPADGTSFLAIGTSGVSALQRAERSGLGLRFAKPAQEPRP